MPCAQERQKPASILGKELECDGSVDGNISAETKPAKGGDGADGVKVGRGSDEHAEDRGEDACQVEGPATTFLDKNVIRE